MNRFFAPECDAVDLIQLNSYPHWHKADDTIDKVSAQSMKIVGETVLASLPKIWQVIEKSKKNSHKEAQKHKRSKDQEQSRQRAMLTSPEILVPMDFSPCSVNALRVAIGMAAPEGDLTLLHVIDEEFVDGAVAAGMGYHRGH